MREDSRDREKHLAIHSLFTAIQRTFESMLVASKSRQDILFSSGTQTSLAEDCARTDSEDRKYPGNDCEFRWE